MLKGKNSPIDPNSNRSPWHQFEKICELCTVHMSQDIAMTASSTPHEISLALFQMQELHLGHPYQCSMSLLGPGLLLPLHSDLREIPGLYSAIFT